MRLKPARACPEAGVQTIQEALIRRSMRIGSEEVRRPGLRVRFDAHLAPELERLAFGGLRVQHGRPPLHTETNVLLSRELVRQRAADHA